MLGVQGVAIGTAVQGVVMGVVGLRAFLDVQGVVARAAGQDVVLDVIPRVEGVVAFITVQLVSMSLANYRYAFIVGVYSPEVQHIVARAAMNRVVARRIVNIKFVVAFVAVCLVVV